MGGKSGRRNPGGVQNGPRTGRLTVPLLAEDREPAGSAAGEEPGRRDRPAGRRPGERRLRDQRDGELVLPRCRVLLRPAEQKRGRRRRHHNARQGLRRPHKTRRLSPSARRWRSSPAPPTSRPWVETPLFLAALLPLTLNVAVAAPDGFVTTDQV